MNIKEKQILKLDIRSVKFELKKELLLDSSSSYADVLRYKIESLEAKLALLEDNTPETKFIATKKGSNGLRYKEVEINGQLFLECTSCSADGPGNCGCWSID